MAYKDKLLNVLLQTILEKIEETKLRDEVKLNIYFIQKVSELNFCKFVAQVSKFSFWLDN